MDWVRAWTGLPYRLHARGPDEYDCLGLFLAIHKERWGRDLPDPRETSETTSLMGLVVEVAPHEVIEGDGLLFERGRRPLHLGYALNAQDMLHMDRGSSCVVSWPALPRLIGAYRFA